MYIAEMPHYLAMLASQFTFTTPLDGTLSAARISTPQLLKVCFWNLDLTRHRPHCWVLFIETHQPDFHGMMIFILMMDKVQIYQGNVHLLGDFNIDLLKASNTAWNYTTSLFGLT